MWGEKPRKIIRNKLDEASNLIEFKTKENNLIQYVCQYHQAQKSF